MGVFDDMTALLGKGMNAADKKSQEYRLQNELGRIASLKEKALADLGRAVLLKEGSSSSFAFDYADHIKVIGDLEAQESSIKKQIELLQKNETLVTDSTMQTANAAVQGILCSACGSPVNLEVMYCQNCGDNLAELKSKYKKCATCNVFYPIDCVFCEKCGSKTVELEVAKPMSAAISADTASVPVSAASVETSKMDTSEGIIESANENQINDSNGQIKATSNSVSSESVCPSCGEALKLDAAFCGSCGKKIEARKDAE